MAARAKKHVFLAIFKKRGKNGTYEIITDVIEGTIFNFLIFKLVTPKKTY